MHKVGNAGIFVLLKFKNKLDGEVNTFNLHSTHHDKRISALRHIQLLTVLYFITLENVQKCQCFQNSITNTSQNQLTAKGPFTQNTDN